ncbi:hypothetical protein QA612_22395 [Evansella sp. AB-P1]|uniref:hypothetical protein n=1 Tax=Evansella sp. AB-P1 TaxID=3037653 RepID=UPI00242026EE|nr:hypothetical protein [Evansella sp. AB-P1]MDG5790193.1 hypothetical protein [Evansella sp. AB-P1]
MKNGKNINFKRLVFAIFLVFLTIVVYAQTDITSQYNVKGKYYEVIQAMERLYGNHQHKNGSFYNGEFKSYDEVRGYLSPLMTDEAIEKVINEFFEKEKGQLIYSCEFQDYLANARESYYTSQVEEKFYGIIQDSILNPGLQLVLDEQLEIRTEGDTIIAEINKVAIHYFDDQEVNHHYTRLGYPPNDLLLASFVFVEEDGDLLLHDFEVVSKKQSNT